jgi:uncharacterized protein YdhG (YjbR/CyaY superfamily)
MAKPTGNGFTEDERAAMKQRAEELRSTKGLKGAAKLAREVEACLEVIDGLTGSDQQIAVRLHAIVTEEAPHLTPKTMYGFPAYAKDGQTVVFFQQASKFNTRYGTIAFQEAANLDDGEMWVTSYAVLEMTDAAEQTIRAMVRKAAS